MTAPRPRHRRWLVRRRRFWVAQGWLVMDTWLHVPLLPRRIISYRRPDGRPGGGRIFVDVPPIGGDVVLGGLVVVVLVGSIVHDVMKGQLVERIPAYLLFFGGLSILTVVGWRATRHARAGVSAHDNGALRDPI